MMRPMYKKIFAYLLVFVLIAAMACPAFAENDKQNKRIIKVGTANHPGFIAKGEDGEMVGYGVEYLNEVCKYTNWDIQYVYASWTEQLEMLERGELDVVPMAQYTEERTGKYKYTDQSIGIMQYLIFADVDSKGMYYADYEAFDGKTIGIQKGSKNIETLREYAKEKGFSYKLIQYDFQSEMEDALAKGDIDLIAGEQMSENENLRIVDHLGSDAYYFITAKDNNGVLDELNKAISQISAHDPIFRSKLYVKYYGKTVANTLPAFTREEAEFIASMGPIKVALIPKSRPGSYEDEDRNVAGIVPDILDIISELSGLKFDYGFVPLDKTPLQHMTENPDLILGGVIANNPAFQNGEIILSDSFYNTYAGLAVSTSKNKVIELDKGEYTIGVLPSYQALQLFIKENYPNLKIVTDYYTSDEGLRALSDGKIDIFAYDLNMMLYYWGNPHMKNMNVISSTFMEEPQCIAAMDTAENAMLIEIIDKCIAAIPQDTIDEIEKDHLKDNYYHQTSADMLYQFRVPLICIFIIVLTIILAVFIGIRRERNNAEAIRQKNEQLTEAVMLAEQANKAKSDFLSRMSHDIRTPMNAIKGMTVLIRKEVVGNEKAEEYLDKTESASQVLLQLLNDILDSAAIESGKLKIVNETFNIDKDLRTITNLYDARCAEKGIKFTFSCEEIDKPMIIGDSLRLNQILINLLSNAYKFTERGGEVSISVKIAERTESGLRLSFAVKDTGCGMSEEMLSRLFEPFEQADASTAHRYGGSGLGLNIVKNLVDMMKGSINVDSAPGVGTKFEVELPFEIDAEACLKEGDKKNEGSEHQNISFDFTGKCVLAADDDAFNRDVLKGILNIVHCDVVCVADGADAVNTFVNSTPGSFDAILLDIHMTDMGGYEAAEAIRASAHPDAKTIPIFALTADAFPEDVKKALDSGMNGHLAKPIDTETLFGTLEEAFGNNA